MTIEELRAFKHHVLKDVSGSGRAGHFVARADFVSHHHSCDRESFVGHEENTQAIGCEFIFLDPVECLDVLNALGQGRGKGAEREGGDE